MVEIDTFTPEELRAAGRGLVASLPNPAILVLIGDLGAGKTTLTQGLAVGLGVADESEVASPTYTLIHEYRRPGVTLYHLDLYRIETNAQLETLGLEDIFSPPPAHEQRVIAIEWGERVEAQLPRPFARISITAPLPDRRRVQLAWQH